VAKAVERYRDLLIHWKLRMIGIIEEDGIQLQGGDKFIEGDRADTELLPEVVCTSSFQRGKSMVEVGGAARQIVARLLVALLIHCLHLLPNPSTQSWPPVHVV
jgi:hypothetical protein